MAMAMTYLALLFLPAPALLSTSALQIPVHGRGENGTGDSSVISSAALQPTSPSGRARSRSPMRGGEVEKEEGGEERKGPVEGVLSGGGSSKAERKDVAGGVGS